MNLPNDFIQKYRKLLKNEAFAFLSSFSQKPISAFRIESQRFHSDLSIYQPIPEIPSGYYGKISGKQIEFLSGAVYSQEPSAMYVAQVLAPTSKDFVLDLCAAPGGKTTYLASQMGNKGRLLANEIDLKRAKILTENVGRMGYRNVVVSNETPENLANKFPTTFSKILVDAPCSGEGMFRKDPKAIQYWSLAYPKSCAKKQKRILKAALRMLSPGGTLVYSTCTFSPEENEGVISTILEENPDLKLSSIPNPPVGARPGEPSFGNNNPELRKCLRFYPHCFKGEGQFVAKIKKVGHLSKSKLKTRIRNSRLNSEIKNFSDVILKEYLKDIFRVSDQYYLLNQHFYEEVKDLHLIKRGVKIGSIKKNRFIPHQELFLSLPKQTFKRIISLNDEQFKAYCHGEELKIGSNETLKSWIALSYQDYIFAFGHLVQGNIKNFYPKNLRNY